MATANNPAGRLYNLLVEARKQPPGTEARKVWALLLHVESNDTPTLLRRLARVLEVPALIRERVARQQSVNRALLLEWMPSVELALSNVTLGGPWKSFLGHFDEKTMYGLNLCSDILSRHCAETIIDEGELENIGQEVGTLIEEISGARIEEDVKQFMLDHLAAITDALNDYWIAGATPLRKALESSVGAIVLDSSIISKVNAAPHGSRFWTIVGRVGVVLSIAWNALQLSGRATALLQEAVSTGTTRAIQLPRSVPEETMRNEADLGTCDH